MLRIAAFLLLCTLAANSEAKQITIPKAGPCKGSITPRTTMYVNTLADLYNRTFFPNTTTVLMYINRNITVPGYVNLNAKFSCTIIRANPALQGVTPIFYLPGNANATMVIREVTNLMIIGVGFKLDWTYIGQLKCNWNTFSWLQEKPQIWIDSMWTCPCILIHHSFNILISQAYISGRTDIMRSGNVEISYSYAIADQDFWWSYNSTNMANGAGWNWCTIRVLYCGDPVNLVRANIKIAHNTLIGSSTTVLMYFTGVGVTVQNNYFTGFGFSGIQCAQGMQNVADCMLNTYENNYIEQVYGQGDPDGAGIYYDLHWFNPGNRDSCNYITGVPHCWYIDYTSSGILLEGGVCINSGSGIKGNTGKFNKAESIVMLNRINKSFGTGWVSCMNWCYNRCGIWAEAPPTMYQWVSQKWWDTFIAKYNNQLWNTNYPYLQTVCTTPGYNVSGKFYSCNPGFTNIPNPNPNWPGPNQTLPDCWQFMQYNNVTKKFSSPTAEWTGNCSGLPVFNSYDIIYVTNMTNIFTSKYYGQRYQTVFFMCEPFPEIVPKTNFIQAGTLPRYVVYELGFNDEDNLDYGADNPSAKVYQKYPKFYSCPRRLVGPQRSLFARTRNLKAMFSKFNRYPPRWYHNTEDIFPSKLVRNLRPGFLPPAYQKLVNRGPRR